MHYELWRPPQAQVVAYLSACQRAVESDEFFQTFRSDKHYRVVLEHSKPSEGPGLFKLACDIDEAFVRRNFHTFQENDLYGGTNITEYPFGRVSVHTLRYIYLLTLIRKHTGPLKDTDIVEIGGGYGGLCRMIMAACKPRSYTLFDLKWPLLLSKKYLGRYGLEDTVTFRESGDFEGVGNVDVVISTWALAELEAPLQDAYCSGVIDKSNYGFTTWNTPLISRFVAHLTNLGRHDIVTEKVPHATVVRWREVLV